ncbi:hypothetical protein [Sporosarcina sp. SAFN-010]
MKKIQVTTFILIGGLIGLLTNGIIIGVGVGALVYIAYNFDELLKSKS